MLFSTVVFTQKTIDIELHHVYDGSTPDHFSMKIYKDGIVECQFDNYPILNLRYFYINTPCGRKKLEQEIVFYNDCNNKESIIYMSTLENNRRIKFVN